MLGDLNNTAFTDSGKQSLTMDKALIIEAWGRYRPSSKENSPRSVALLNKPGGKRDIQMIYGDSFMKRLIAGVKQKTYLSKAERLNGVSDGTGKNDAKLQEQLNYLLMNGGSGSPDNNADDEQLSEDGNEGRGNGGAEDDSALENIPEEEV